MLLKTTAGIKNASTFYCYLTWLQGFLEFLVNCYCALLYLCVLGYLYISGKIAVIGGCREYTGAPYFAAITALKIVCAIVSLTSILFSLFFLCLTM